MILRDAVMADASFLCHLRNAPTVRVNSWNARPISWRAHCRWLSAALADPKRRVFIAIDTLSVEPVGTGRLCLDTGDVEFSIAIIKEARGKGHGTDLVRELLVKAAMLPAHYATAKIRAANAASLIAFIKNGFAPWAMQEGPRGDWVVLRRRLR